MAEVEASYALLTDADKAVFDEYLKGAYDKYVMLNHKNIEERTDLGEWADDFAELASSLENIELALWAFEYYAQYGVYEYPLMNIIIASFEQARAIGDKILASGDQAIINAFLYEPYPFLMDEDGEADEDLSLSDELEYYRLYSNSMLLDSSMKYTYYDIFTEYEMQDFFSKIAYPMLAYMYYDYDEEAGEDEPMFAEPQRVLEAMAAFRELNAFAQYIFMAYEYSGYVTGSCYFGALTAFFEEVLTLDGNDAAVELMEAEYNFVLYAYSGQTKYLSEVGKSLRAFERIYRDLEEDDKQYLDDMYNFYKSAYEQAMEDEI